MPKSHSKWKVELDFIQYLENRSGPETFDTSEYEFIHYDTLRKPLYVAKFRSVKERNSYIYLYSDSKYGIKEFVTWESYDIYLKERLTEYSK